MDDSSRYRERVRIIAFALGFSVIISLAFLVFASIQKAEARKQREFAEMSRMEAEHQRFMAEQARMQLQETRQALEACQKK